VGGGMTRDRAGQAAIVVVLLLLSIPLFFSIYRDAAFNTAPRDDYGPYLQSIVGAGGHVPGAPMAYRLFSVLLAVPFYFVLPVYHFSNLPAVDPNYLKATEAISATSWLCLLAMAGVIYVTCRDKAGATRKSAFLVALLALFFAQFTGVTTIDPIALLIISVLIYFFDRIQLFAPLVVVSVGFNEKVAFLFVIVFGLRLLLARDRSALSFLAVSLLAAVVYFAVRIIVAEPGNGNQTSPSTYWHSLVSTMKVSLTLKGLVINVLPIVLVALVAWLDVRMARQLGYQSALWRNTDALVFLGMLLIGLAIDVQYTAGRLVMFTFPLYMPLLALRLDATFPDGAAQQEGSGNHGIAQSRGHDR
jgi:hypothetical protein